MSLPPPIAAENKHCCALACVSYLTHLYRKPATQTELLAKYDGMFAEWTRKPPSGLLTRGTLFDLLFLENFLTTRFVITPRWEEVIAAIKHHGRQNFRAGFVFQREPTNHCFLIVEPPTLEEPNKSVLLMFPDPPMGLLGMADPLEIEQNAKPDFLLFFA